MRAFKGNHQGEISFAMQNRSYAMAKVRNKISCVTINSSNYLNNIDNSLSHRALCHLAARMTFFTLTFHWDEKTSLDSITN